MIAALLISLREGLEASLIVGIVFSYLRKTNQMRYRWHAWAGVAVAIAVSLVVALSIQIIGAELEGQMEQIFEGVMMLFAVIVLTWMIFWMRSQARSMKGELEAQLADVVHLGSPRGLFAVTFFAVAREGIETALLLTAMAFTMTGTETIVGTLLGLALAAAIGFMIYASTIRLNVRTFFNITSVLLLLFAAGLLTNSIHEFQEAGLVTLLSNHVWDISSILGEEGTLGAILKALFGYNSSPTLMELVAYLGYWVFALVGMPWLVERSIRDSSLSVSNRSSTVISTHS